MAKLNRGVILDLIRSVLFLFIGFIGQYFDVSIGMGYGTITVPLLLLLGVPPIYTVPAILLSKTVLGVFSGGVHQVAGNVKRKVVLPLTITGILGTVFGVPLTFFWSDREINALIGIILMAIGFLSLLNVARGVKMGVYSPNKIRVSGFFAGFTNGISGGGYGAISTTGLVSAGIDTKVAIGSTVISETVVALSGVLFYSFLLREVDWGLILTLLIGGAIATPIGALTTKRSPSKKLGTVIAVIVMFLGVSSAIVRSEALVLGLVAVASVLITYHFKMVGNLRLRVAIGGINLGIGAFMISLVYLNQTGSAPFHVPPPLTGIFFWGLTFIGAIFIAAGILGVSVKS
jgi:uncharacterized membrane protein YfcA